MFCTALRWGLIVIVLSYVATNPFVTQSVSEQFFFSQYFKLPYFKTIISKQLTFFERMYTSHHVSFVACHLPCVTCHKQK